MIKLFLAVLVPVVAIALSFPIGEATGIPSEGVFFMIGIPLCLIVVGLYSALHASVVEDKLARCPACSNKVSKEASKCPKCGDPLKEAA